MYYQVIATPSNGPQSRDEFYKFQRYGDAMKDARRRARKYWRVEVEAVTESGGEIDNTALVSAFEDGVQTC